MLDMKMFIYHECAVAHHHQLQDMKVQGTCQFMPQKLICQRMLTFKHHKALHVSHYMHTPHSSFSLLSSVVVVWHFNLCHNIIMIRAMDAQKSIASKNYCDSI